MAKFAYGMFDNANFGEIPINIYKYNFSIFSHTFKAFDSTGSSVKCLCLDTNADIIAAGSNEGDIKVGF